MTEGKSSNNNDSFIVVSYPVTITVDTVLNYYNDEEKQNRIVDLFDKAESDRLTGDELLELKGIIKDVAKHYFSELNTKSVIQKCDYDILIDKKGEDNIEKSDRATL